MIFHFTASIRNAKRTNKKPRSRRGFRASGEESGFVGLRRRDQGRGEGGGHPRMRNGQAAAERAGIEVGSRSPAPR